MLEKAAPANPATPATPLVEVTPTAQQTGASTGPPENTEKKGKSRSTSVGPSTAENVGQSGVLYKRSDTQRDIPQQSIEVRLVAC